MKKNIKYNLRKIILFALYLFLLINLIFQSNSYTNNQNTNTQEIIQTSSYNIGYNQKKAFFCNLIGDSEICFEIKDNSSHNKNKNLEIVITPKKENQVSIPILNNTIYLPLNESKIEENKIIWDNKGSVLLINKINEIPKSIEIENKNSQVTKIKELKTYPKIINKEEDETKKKYIFYVLIVIGISLIGLLITEISFSSEKKKKQLLEEERKEYEKKYLNYLQKYMLTYEESSTKINNHESVENIKKEIPIGEIRQIIISAKLKNIDEKILYEHLIKKYPKELIKEMLDKYYSKN